MGRPPKTNVAPPDVDDDAASNGKGEPPARILIPLTMKGTVDWNRIHTPNRKAKIRRLLKELQDLEPKTAAAPDAPAPSAETLDVFSAEWSHLAIDSVGRLEFAAALRAGCTRQEAALFLYTADEKKLLADPLARVLNKYGNLWLAKYQEEAALAALLVSIHTMKFSALSAMRQARQAPSGAAAAADRVVHLADRQAPAPASAPAESSS